MSNDKDLWTRVSSSRLAWADFIIYWLTSLQSALTVVIRLTNYQYLFNTCLVGLLYRGGGTQIIFYWGVRSEVWNPYPYLKIFLFFFFFVQFSNGFSTSKTTDFTYIFYFNFSEMEPFSKDFLTKMGFMSKNFWWKSSPFGLHIPVCLNMWVPPPQGFYT